MMKGDINSVDINLLARQADFNFSCFRRLALGLVFVCLIFQLLFFGWVDGNAYCSILVAVCSGLAALYVLRRSCFDVAPVASLMVLFFNVSSLGGALIFKTLEGAALVDSLRVPVTTFSVLSFSMLIVVFSHFVFCRARFFRLISVTVSAGILKPLGTYVWPVDGVLWLLGGIGVAAAVIAKGDVAGADAGAFTKLLVGVSYLKYAPFLLPFRYLSGVDAPTSSRTFVAVIGYFLLIVLVGLVQNSRGAFMDALFLCVCLALLVFCLGRLSLRWFTPLRVLLILCVAAVAYVLMSRLALAMVAVRPYRDSVGLLQLLGLTVEAFFNSAWRSSYEASEISSVYIGDYGEGYVASRLVSRLLMTKFHDNMFYYLSLLDSSSISFLRSYVWDCVVSLLPAPVIDLLGLSLDKSALRQSFGDYVIYLVDGWGLGGYKTGSLIACLFALFPFSFVFLLIFVSLASFSVFESLRDGQGRYSPVLLMGLWGASGVLSVLNSESLAAVLSSLLRGVPQALLIYLIISSFLGFLVGKRGRA